MANEGHIARLLTTSLHDLVACTPPCSQTGALVGDRAIRRAQQQVSQAASCTPSAL